MTRWETICLLKIFMTDKMNSVTGQAPAVKQKKILKKIMRFQKRDQNKKRYTQLTILKAIGTLVRPINYFFHKKFDAIISDLFQQPLHRLS